MSTHPLVKIWSLSQCIRLMGGPRTNPSVTARILLLDFLLPPLLLSDQEDAPSPTRSPLASVADDNVKPGGFSLERHTIRYNGPRVVRVISNPLRGGDRCMYGIAIAIAIF